MIFVKLNNFHCVPEEKGSRKQVYIVYFSCMQVLERRKNRRRFTRNLLIFIFVCGILNCSIFEGCSTEIYMELFVFYKCSIRQSPGIIYRIPELARTLALLYQITFELFTSKSSVEFIAFIILMKLPQIGFDT